MRKKAAWSLGAIGAPVSVAGPALQTAATSDPNPFVRSLAQVAISQADSAVSAGHGRRARPSGPDAGHRPETAISVSGFFRLC